jgi:hypothetical protein
MLGWRGLNDFLPLVTHTALSIEGPSTESNVLVNKVQILQSVFQMMNDWVHFEKLWRALKFILSTINRKVKMEQTASGSLNSMTYVLCPTT